MRNVWIESDSENKWFYQNIENVGKSDTITN